MRIAGFILTRDSWIWFWTQIVGGFALIASTLSDPSFQLIDSSALITPINMHKLQVMALLVTWFSAKMSTSALPGKTDADKVSLPAKEQK